MSSPSIASCATDCCIVGGGPAGLMLGYLLARAGVSVTVLEKHDDFLRDFRGDTIHPSTLELMHQLGLLDELLALPHQRAETLWAEIAGRNVMLADFSRLPTRCKFIAFMPQWEFLTFLAERAAAFPHFTLIKSARVTELCMSRAGRAACWRRPRKGRSTFPVSWLSAPTDGVPWCGKRRGSAADRSVCRGICCG